MKHLLDTGVWLRAVNQPQTIPARTLRLLETPREMFGLAAISLWEVGKKVQSGKLPLPKDLPGWFDDALAPNIELLALTGLIRPSNMTVIEDRVGTIAVVESAAKITHATVVVSAPFPFVWFGTPTTWPAGGAVSPK